MKRSFVQIGGVLYEKGTEPQRESGPMVMGDIQPFVSMVDGTLITSRWKKNAHYRAHGVVEVGNDPLVTNPQRKPLQSPPGLKEALIRAADQHLRRR